MIFKNITKKNICVLLNGQKLVIKPNESIDGDKEFFQNYKGLMKIVNPKLPVKKILPPVIDEIVIEENDSTPIRKREDIQIDFIVVEDL